MRRIWLLVATAAAAGGCGGEFILTAPDVTTLPGKPAPMVVRLQRREFWLYTPPLAGSAITFRVGDGPLRAARTDQAGYAALGVHVPAKPGRYDVDIYHQDVQGETLTARASVYVLFPDTPIAVVDMDSLPAGGDEAVEAAAALRRIQRQAQIIYATQNYADQPRRAHQVLAKVGYPDAAVQPYVKLRSWHSKRPWRPPDPPKALVLLQERFGRLRWGVAGDAASAKAFDRAGLKVLVVGDVPVRLEAAEFFRSWKGLRLVSAGGGD